jgi:hypothetical protein
VARAACEWRGLGLLLSAVVPKNLLFALSAGLIVGEAGFSGGQAAVVFVIVHGDRHFDRGGTSCRSPRGIGTNARAIERLREWLVENNVTIMVVVLLVTGVVMIGNSIASL